MEVYFIGLPLKELFGGKGGYEGFWSSLRGSHGVQGEIIMLYFTLDLWTAGGELLVNLQRPALEQYV